LIDCPHSEQHQGGTVKLITRLAAGAAIAGALCGLAGAPGAAAASDDVHVMFGLAGTAAVAAPAVTDDVHINYVAGPYPSREVCEAARAITEIWNTTWPCVSRGSSWYFEWK
jgi:hypothetical protein